MLSGWTTKLTDVGPGVSGQAVYDAPDDLHLTIRLEVEDVPYRQMVDWEGFRAITRGDHALRANGVFFVEGTEPAPSVQYRIFPRAENGDQIQVLHIFVPAPMVDPPDEPAVPEAYHRAVVDYAKGVAFGSDEDNAELDTYYRGLFNATVQELAALRLTREGQDPRDAIMAAATKAPS